MGFKSGFITIIGRPNVGKSTFMNQVLGQKIAIMSDKPQTTRNKISGIHTTADSQLIFIDTPGVHKPKHELGSFMNNIAISSLNHVDCVLFMVSGIENVGPGDRMIMEHLKKVKVPVFLIVNKLDLAKDKHRLSQTVQAYKDEFEFAKVYEISALTRYNVDYLLEEIAEVLEEGPQYYPSDQITDHPERFIISEIIREKVLHSTRDEVPHSVAVVIESLTRDEENPNLINVMATIMVERDSQKGILIGKGGEMLKKIGTQARQEIKNILGSKVFLETFVKVKKDWRNKKLDLADFGYKNEDY